MTFAITQSLISALSKLHAKFRNDPEAFHFATAVVFSSILNKNGLSCIIVGGQSAAYWMRIPGSIDIDFVSPDIGKIAIVLETAGFIKSPDYAFRFTHPRTDALIELVGERIKIADMKTRLTIQIKPPDIDDPLVRSLMTGSAQVLNPLMVFFNYLEASSTESIWYDIKDHGALAFERAQALLALYRPYFLRNLRARNKKGEISKRIKTLLHEKLQVVL